MYVKCNASWCNAVLYDKYSWPAWHISTACQSRTCNLATSASALSRALPSLVPAGPRGPPFAGAAGSASATACIEGILWACVAPRLGAKNARMRSACTELPSVTFLPRPAGGGCARLRHGTQPAQCARQPEYRLLDALLCKSLLIHKRAVTFTFAVWRAPVPSKGGCRAAVALGLSQIRSTTSSVVARAAVSQTRAASADAHAATERPVLTALAGVLRPSLIDRVATRSAGCWFCAPLA